MQNTSPYNDNIDGPHMVTSHDVRLDNAYADWIAEVKQRYRSAQVKAAVKVNVEKLIFNWQLGRDLVQKKAEERWGAGVVEQVSLDLKREFPNAEGFSTLNLWYMKRWYLFYTTQISSQRLQQLVNDLYLSTNHIDKNFTSLVEKCHLLIVNNLRIRSNLLTFFLCLLQNPQ